MNYCKIEIRFVCNTHSQSNCNFFEKDISIPSLTCKFGLPDRKCRNDKANQKALMSFAINRLMNLRGKKGKKHGKVVET